MLRILGKISARLLLFAVCFAGAVIILAFELVLGAISDGAIADDLESDDDGTEIFFWEVSEPDDIGVGWYSL